MRHTTHDIIVIGAGSGGLTTAIFMQREGFRVLLVDRTKESFGGDCLNYGCVPSKALISLSKSYRGTGENDIKTILDTVKKRQNIIRTHENPDYLQSIGIDIAIGDAVFTGKTSIEVDGTSYSAKKIVIATGSRPRPLTIPGSGLPPTYTNESVFSMTQLPKEFVFIGGGPIAIELGQAFNRLGSHVTIIQSSDRILPREDPEVSQLIRDVLEADGVTIITNAAVQEIKDGGLIIKTGDDELRTINADAVFVAIGRIPNLEQLQLNKAGIKQDDKGSVVLDSTLRTTNKAVFVIGDAAGKEMFTHVAELQAQLVLRNFFSPFKKSYQSEKLGWTTFTDPEVSTFGLSKQQLGKAHMAFEEVSVSLADDDRAITEDATNGFLKIFVSKKGHILGGTMVGNRSGEVTSELLLMMHSNISLGAVLSKPFPYPISSRVIQTAAREFSAKTLYSSRTQRLLHFLYR